MTSVKKLALAIAFCSAASAHASFVEWTPAKETYETVALSSSGTVKLGNREVVMSPRLGKGLREKSTIFGKVRVSVVQLFASAPEKFVRTEAEALGSLLQSEVVTVHQTFLRNVTASQVEGAFVDGFNANQATLKEVGLALNQSPLKDFIATVRENADTDSGQTMTITVVRGEGKSALVYENGNGDMFKFEGNEGLAKAVLSLWMGESADDGVVALKKSLISGN